MLSNIMAIDPGTPHFDPRTLPLASYFPTHPFTPHVDPCTPHFNASTTPFDADTP